MLSRPFSVTLAVTGRGVAGTYNRAQYLDQRREALGRYAEHIRGLTRARLSVVK